MNGWLIATLVAGVASVPLAAWRARVYRLETRLRSPMLNGLPLPAVDDPRWRLDGRWALFGPGHVRQEPHAPFAADHLDGEVRFENRTIGHWLAYAKAVRAPLAKRLQEDAARRALAAICDDPPK